MQVADDPERRSRRRVAATRIARSPACARSRVEQHARPAGAVEQRFHRARPSAHPRADRGGVRPPSRIAAQSRSRTSHDRRRSRRARGRAVPRAAGGATLGRRRRHASTTAAGPAASGRRLGRAPPDARPSAPARTVSGSLTTPFAWRPTAIRSPCAQRARRRERLAVDQRLVGGPGDRRRRPMAVRRRARARIGGCPRTRRPGRTAAPAPCRARCARRSAASGRPGRAARCRPPRSARRGRSLRPRRVRGRRSRAASAPAAGFAPRPLRTARSSAAVGRAAGSGERQRCSAALTSALLAGGGIGPSSAGGFAA